MEINQCSEKYKQYLESPKWQEIRERILLRDNFQCQICGQKLNLHCHHIRGTHRFHEEKHPEDLMILCSDCHTMIHNYWRICD